jgi:hypothetical protein
MTPTGVTSARRSIRLWRGSPPASPPIRLGRVAVPI